MREGDTRGRATVMHVGFDRLGLLVERPPQSQEAALAVAAEHFAVCPDNIYQGVGSMSEYAEVTTATWWSFWWD